MTDNDDRNGQLRGTWLAWVWVLPQVVLLWFNLRVWMLVRGDLAEAQRVLALKVGAFEVVLLFCGVASLAWYSLRRRSVGPLIALGALGLHVGYLWFFLAHMDRILPPAVSLWMLPETEFMFYQFSLMMPAVFLMLVRLAQIRTGLSKMADLGISVGLLVCVPMGIYIVGMALTRLARSFTHFESFGMQYFLIAGLIAATALVLVAFLKILLRLHEAISGQAWSQWAIPIFAGLVAPLAGLALNAGIPFPYDFQDIAVYALTILNGAALLIPFRPGSRWAVSGWALRAILFPFSLYFFLIFLPFFPLSLLAMIAAGSGVLILAPILLVAIQGKLLLTQGRILSTSYGGRIIVAGFAACLLVLPALFVVRCDSDRRTLGKAIDAVYSPDYHSKSISFSHTRLSRALKHMDDVKNGIYLPYLTDAYNTIVFRGMVLPDEKADLIRKSLLGTAPEHGSWALWGRGVFGGRPRGLRTSRGNGVAHDVQMAAPDVASRTTNDVVEADVKFTLENRGSGNSEFVAPVIVPEGVLVTGFWLDVNGTNKPAQLREKKTAVWVYEMIRDMTRRDPGLLIYETDTRLRLRVYPFDSAQSRKCGISFRFPAALHPVVQIKDMPVALNSSSQSGSSAVALVLPAGGEALTMSPAPEGGLPRFVREPVAHIILDHSAAASGKEAETIGAAKAAIAALPDTVKRVTVTWANYDQVSVLSGPESRDAAIATLEKQISLPSPRGGFCPELVIARELFDEQGNTAQASPPPAGSVPLFVVIPAPGSSSIRTRILQPLARSIPDMPAYFEYCSNEWSKISFESGNKETVSPSDTVISPVMAVRKAGHIELLSTAGGGLVCAAPNTGKGSWEYWDAVANAFRPIEGVAQCTDQMYVNGIALLARHRSLEWDPGAIDAALPGLVADARAAGVMIPETAFVVVETSAQEVMLARKEQQALSADHALEFDDVKPTQTTPAPSTLWIMPLALYFLFRHRRSRSCRHSTP